MKILISLICLILAACGGGSDSVSDREIGPNERCVANLDAGKCPVDAIVPIQGGPSGKVPG